MKNSYKTFNLGDLAEIKAGGDKPREFSTFQSSEFLIPIYANGETNLGLQGYTNKAKVKVPAITVSARGTIGFTVLRKFPFFPIVRLLSVIPNEKLLNVTYLYYYFRLNRPTGIGSSQSQLIAPELSKYKIAVPNIIYQQKIASILSALDDKIELNHKINAELEAMVKTLYDYWFVQFEFPISDTEALEVPDKKPYKSSGGKMVYNETLKREIPEGWVLKRLHEIIEVKDGTHDSPKYIDENGYPLVTSKNLKKTGIDFRETNKISKIDFDVVNQRSKVDTGDILFSMIGSIGTIYKVEETVIDFAIKNVALFKTSQYLELKNFIYQYLHSYDMQRYLPNVISGSIQKFVGLGSLRNIPILFDLDIINLFNKESESLFEKKTNIIQQNQELAQLRDWLLPMLMNGQVSVEDVQDEVLAMVAEPVEDYTKTVNLNKEKSIEDRFQLWLSNQKLAARGGINETVLREIFDVMDDEDK